MRIIKSGNKPQEGERIIVCLTCVAEIGVTEDDEQSKVWDINGDGALTTSYGNCLNCGRSLWNTEKEET